MTFIWPSMLLLLTVIPFFVIVFLIVQKRRIKVADQFFHTRPDQVAVNKQLKFRRLVPPMLYLLSMVVLLIALARPQAEVSLPRYEGTAIIAFDVSGSMAADDINPTRMEAAKEVSENLVQIMPSSVQLGVVAFSDSGFLVQAPSSNKDDILAAISRLSPQRGTSLGQGIITSLRAIANQFDDEATEHLSQEEEDLVFSFDLADKEIFATTILILLSDGENNMDPDPLEAARLAAQYGLRIYTIGVGSIAGTTLNINGFNIHSQLDEAVLKEISQISNGAYFNAQFDEDLLIAFSELSPMLRVRPERIEITSILTATSMLFMLTGAFFSFAWFRRLP
jgi:Ca-activated chloride channel homolog